ncbi:hypothetical protein B4N89_01435 [Embleya scabrispora]|uniref:Uncharacterized protein n=1 Tax=Embleya scabrispora TaxID=159449 RepID=A0A1T3NSP5_9ACTN|nr:hypothetical protein [Embleya scabrispora]OPC79784.1 hypothetical protein B4N89_01435 [Embleya scabrispora]
MSDFEARIEAERRRSAGSTPAARRPADWAAIAERVEALLTATAAEFDRRGIAALPVLGYPPPGVRSRLTGRRPTVVAHRRPVPGLFSLDHAGRPFLERDPFPARQIWLRTSHPGRARTLEAAVLRAGLTPDTLILDEGPPIPLDPDEAARNGRLGGRFDITADGTLLVYPAADAPPIPLVEALTAAVTGGGGTHP